MTGARWTAVLGLILVGVSVRGADAASPAQRKEERDGTALMNAIPKCRSWAALHRLRVKYPSLDDGAAAESYSDFVVRRLADRWSTVPALQREVDRDPAFGKWVVTHVDGSVSDQKLKVIIRNAKRPGSARTARLRRSIGERARAALAGSR